MNKVSEPDVWIDGPPIRVSELVAITGISSKTIRADIASGALKATRRTRIRNSPYLAQRADVRRWLLSLGFHQHAC